MHENKERTKTETKKKIVTKSASTSHRIASIEPQPQIMHHITSHRLNLTQKETTYQ